MPRRAFGDARSRALGLLVGYLLTKFDLKVDNIRSAITDFGDPFSPAKLKDLREGWVTLSTLEFRRLSVYVVTTLRKPAYHDSVLRDYPWIRPLLLETGLDNEINPGGRIQTPQDRSFLRALNVEPPGQRLLRVYERMGGLWHVIRKSVDPIRVQAEEPYYNVSLLNIKPVNYISAINSSATQSTDFHTLVSHFSVRSRLGTNEQGRVYIFRGRMFESDNVVYFIGDRREFQTPKLFVMAWSTPPIPEELTHADWAEGMMMTITADNATMIVPIVARYLEGSLEEEVTVGPNGGNERKRFEKLSDEYTKRISDMLPCIKTMKKPELLELLEEDDNGRKLEDMLERFDGTISRTQRRGFLRL